MRRAAAIIALALAAPAASAKPAPVVTVWSMCADAPSWDTLQTCLERFGETRLVRTFEHLKLVSVGEHTVQARAPGLYAYTQRGSALHLVWMWEYASGGKAELFDVRKVSIGGKSGYRFDIGTIEPSVVTLDDETVLEATMQRKTAAFCLGAEMACDNTIESCDVLVDGKAYYTFRGTLAIRDGTAVVTGDRSHAGTCTAPERTPLVSGAR
ncbi:MAG: hypothetical protein HOV81_23670 [Kofleriaceae bacterium]|nr:hypothetical protein [Kofleriaceae bacterium]